MAPTTSAQPQITGPGLATCERRGDFRSGDRLMTGREVQVGVTVLYLHLPKSGAASLRNSIRAGTRPEEAPFEPDDARLSAQGGPHQPGRPGP